MRKKRFAPLSAVLVLNDFMVCDDRDGKTMPKGTFFSGGQKNNEEAKKMKKSVSKTIVTIAIVTAFLMPLMGNTALADTTATFYFDSHYGGEAWSTNPSYMVDGSTATFASTTDDGDVQLLDGNTCPDINPGTITKVEIRARSYYIDSGFGSADIILRSVYSRGDGDNHIFDAPIYNPDWSDWLDITTDTNAPNPWAWTDVMNLDCDVESLEASGSPELFCSKVEIRVTYTQG